MKKHVYKVYTYYNLFIFSKINQTIIHEKKVVLSDITTKLFRGLGFLGLGITYPRLTILRSSISVLRSMVPVCRDGIMSLRCFLMDPSTGSLILT